MWDKVNKTIVEIDYLGLSMIGYYTYVVEGVYCSYQLHLQYRL